jgi:hypothetical protein
MANLADVGTEVQAGQVQGVRIAVFDVTRLSEIAIKILVYLGCRAETRTQG